MVILSFFIFEYKFSNLEKDCKCSFRKMSFHKNRNKLIFKFSCCSVFPFFAWSVFAITIKHLSKILVNIFLCLTLTIYCSLCVLPPPLTHDTTGGVWCVTSKNVSFFCVKFPTNPPCYRHLEAWVQEHFRQNTGSEQQGVHGSTLFIYNCV